MGYSSLGLCIKLLFTWVTVFSVPYSSLELLFFQYRVTVFSIHFCTISCTQDFSSVHSLPLILLLTLLSPPAVNHTIKSACCYMWEDKNKRKALLNQISRVSSPASHYTQWLTSHSGRPIRRHRDWGFPLMPLVFRGLLPLIAEVPFSHCV